MVSTLFALLISVPCAVFAQDTFTFEVTEASHYNEETSNWSVDISVPQITGMADEVEQEDLNAYFVAMGDEMLAEYQDNVEYASENLVEGAEPHFAYQYYWDVVTDSEDYFVLRTSWWMGAGSSTVLNQYWNLDKKTGKLLKFNDDVLTSPEQLDIIHDQILAKMKEINESGEGSFWVDDDYLEISLGGLGYLNHWYYNLDGDLVITFDKYEIGPGVMGCPEFVVSLEPTAAE